MANNAHAEPVSIVSRTIRTMIVLVDRTPVRDVSSVYAMATEMITSHSAVPANHTYEIVNR